MWKIWLDIIVINNKKADKKPISQDSFIEKSSLEVKLTWLLILQENRKNNKTQLEWILNGMPHNFKTCQLLKGKSPL